MKKIRKNRGILFWITGLSGSGKTTIAEKINNDISNKYGPTVIVSGDNLRKMFNLKKFSFFLILHGSWLIHQFPMEWHPRHRSCTPFNARKIPSPSRAMYVLRLAVWSCAFSHLRTENGARVDVS